MPSTQRRICRMICFFVWMLMTQLGSISTALAIRADGDLCSSSDSNCIENHGMPSTGTRSREDDETSSNPFSAAISARLGRLKRTPALYEVVAVVSPGPTISYSGFKEINLRFRRTSPVIPGLEILDMTSSNPSQLGAWPAESFGLNKGDRLPRPFEQEDFNWNVDVAQKMVLKKAAFLAAHFLKPSARFVALRIFKPTASGAQKLGLPYGSVYYVFNMAYNDPPYIAVNINHGSAHPLLHFDMKTAYRSWSVYRTFNRNLVEQPPSKADTYGIRY